MTVCETDVVTVGVALTEGETVWLQVRVGVTLGVRVSDGDEVLEGVTAWDRVKLWVFVIEGDGVGF